jgi:hypothetical protein
MSWFIEKFVHERTKLPLLPDSNLAQMLVRTETGAVVATPLGPANRELMLLQTTEDIGRSGCSISSNKRETKHCQEEQQTVVISSSEYKWNKQNLSAARGNNAAVKKNRLLVAEESKPSLILEA